MAEMMRRRPAIREAILAADSISCLTARFQNHFEMKFVVPAPYWTRPRLPLPAVVVAGECVSLGDLVDPGEAAEVCSDLGVDVGSALEGVVGR